MYYPQASPGVHKLGEAQNGWPPPSRNNPQYMFNPPPPMHQPLHHPIHQHHYSSPPHTNQLSPATIPGQMMSMNWQTQLLKYESNQSHRPPHKRAENSAREPAKHNAAIPITNPNGKASTTPALESSPASVHSESSPQATTVEKQTDMARQAASKSSQTAWSVLDMGGIGIKSIPGTSPLFRYTFLKQLYLNHNALVTLPASISRLRWLEVLDVSGNALTSLPPELGLCAHLKELLFFDNHITTIPPQLGTLCSLQIIGVEGNPIDAAIKSILQSSGTQALIQTLRDSCPSPPEPPPRQWKSYVSPAEREQFASDPSNDSFVVHCSNVLNERFATEKMYGYTPTWALKWEYRRELLMKEMRSSRADLICLQEVDGNSFDDFFLRNLRQDGYEGIIYQKGRHKGLSTEEWRLMDGCATLWQTDKYELHKTQVVEFGQVAMNRKDFNQKSQHSWTRIFQKDHLANVVILKNRQTGSKVLVANLHLIWDVAFTDAKLVQIGLLMDEIDRLLKDDGHSGDDVPVIICGDFNSTPGSGVYEYLSNGFIPATHPDFGNRSYGRFTSEGMRHRFNLKSAYAAYVPQGRSPFLPESEKTPKSELPLTNFVPHFCGVLDYIWFSTGALTCLGAMGELDQTYVESCVGFPNQHIPSDHLSTTAEFRVKPRKG